MGPSTDTILFIRTPPAAIKPTHTPIATLQMDAASKAHAAAQGAGAASRRQTLISTTTAPATELASHASCIVGELGAPSRMTGAKIPRPTPRSPRTQSLLAASQPSLATITTPGQGRAPPKAEGVRSRCEFHDASFVVLANQLVPDTFSA